MVGLKEMARLDAARQPPAWLDPLVATRFFEVCPDHPDVSAIRSTRSIGCNYFCTNCADGALCSGCFADHRGHQLIQIRKSGAHGMVRVNEIKHLLNVSYVQPYLLNGVDALYLDKRPMAGMGRAYSNRSEVCNRGLPYSHTRFCSLGCKAEEIKDGSLDFSVTFALAHRRESSGEESESDDDDSPRPTKLQKQGTLSWSRLVAAKGKRSV